MNNHYTIYRLFSSHKESVVGTVITDGNRVRNATLTVDRCAQTSAPDIDDTTRENNECAQTDGQETFPFHLIVFS